MTLEEENKKNEQKELPSEKSLLPEDSSEDIKEEKELTETENVIMNEDDIKEPVKKEEVEISEDKTEPTEPVIEKKGSVDDFLLQNKDRRTYNTDSKERTARKSATSNVRQQFDSGTKKESNNSRTRLGAKEFNDYPSYFYAGFWTRLMAYLIDLLCIAAVNRILWSNILGNVTAFWSDSFLYRYGLPQLIIYLAYFILLTKLNGGQTIGKMIFGIKVISFKEKELSWLTVILREGVGRFALQSLSFITYLGYLPAAFSEHKQQAADFFADTSVVTLNLLAADQGLEYLS